MRESTKAVFKKHGWRVDRSIHNYIYFAFYYPYVKIASTLLKVLPDYLSRSILIKSVLKAGFNRYHAKVLTFDNTKKILTLNEDLEAVSSRNKKIVPYKYAYKILFQEPEFIAVMDCPCKKSLNDTQESINSCISVGKWTSQFWLDRCGKYNPRKITQQEALDMIKEFRKKGYLTQVFLKVATGGSTGVICNCHPDTCVSLQATKFAKKIDKNLSMSAEAGYSVTYDAEKCKECGICTKICPFDAIVFNSETQTCTFNGCMGCELCVEHCPKGALSLYRDPDKAVPLDIDLVKEEFVEDAI